MEEGYFMNLFFEEPFNVVDDAINGIDVENSEEVVEVTSENSNEELLNEDANDDAVNGVNPEKDKDVVEIAREENANEESENGTLPSLGMIFESFDGAYNFYNLHVNYVYQIWR
ncbi:hypothetical protein GIB67_008730 [Kingdonia uniflora]|uniref:Uncharacterized protein n=1 Tax=Kingdonia uniflora TaxID=39325 RepID=A0A7J7P5F4_9MAGN|nr:hypothetical protein GIB67_008730 [Kingdonia uniflora]